VLEDGSVIALADEKGSGDRPGQVKSYFMHCLKTADHRPLRPDVRAALGLLIREGLVSWRRDPRLWELAYIDSHWHELRRIYADSRTSMMRFEREREAESTKKQRNNGDKDGRQADPKRSRVGKRVRGR